MGPMKPYVHALRLLTALKRVDRPGSTRIEIGFCVAAEVKHWRQLLMNLVPQKVLDEPCQRTITIATDASKIGFGWSLIFPTGRILSYGERWKPSESLLHINILEMMAARRALAMLADKFPASVNSTVVWLADNTTMIAVIFRRISQKFQLHEEAEHLLQLCHNMNWTLVPVWVASADNVADRPSRECAGWSSSTTTATNSTPILSYP